MPLTGRVPGPFLCHEMVVGSPGGDCPQPPSLALWAFFHSLREKVGGGKVGHDG